MIGKEELNKSLLNHMWMAEMMLRSLSRPGIIVSPSCLFSLEIQLIQLYGRRKREAVLVVIWRLFLASNLHSRGVSAQRASFQSQTSFLSGVLCPVVQTSAGRKILSPSLNPEFNRHL